MLLLDEITVDLDVLARADLMTFLKAECEERGATIIYASHIFDGLEAWPTHLVLGRCCFSMKRKQEIHNFYQSSLGVGYGGFDALRSSGVVILCL